MITELKDVRIRRRRLDLTQLKLARLAGVSQSLVAKLEAGRLDPSYSAVKKLEDALKLMELSLDSTAGQIMTRIVVCVESQTSAIDIVKLFEDNAISQVPVLIGKSIVGLVNEASLLSKSQNLDSCKACDVMQLPPPIVQENTKRAVLQVLLASYSCILVARLGVPIGVVTKSDLLSSLI